MSAGDRAGLEAVTHSCVSRQRRVDRSAGADARRCYSNGSPRGGDTAQTVAMIQPESSGIGKACREYSEAAKSRWR